MAEIARKRKLQQDAKAALGGAKWVRRGDVEQVRVQQYHEEEARQTEERAKKAVAPQFRNVPSRPDVEVVVANTAAKHDDGQSASDDRSKACDAGKEKPKPTEVKRKLRILGQPIQLFGEDDEERLERYRAVSSALPSQSEVDDQLKAGQTWGQNESQLFDALGQKLKQQDASESTAVGGSKEDDEEGDDELAPTFVATTPEQTISRHFKQLVKMWEAQLTVDCAQRSPSVGTVSPGVRLACTRVSRMQRVCPRRPPEMCLGIVCRRGQRRRRLVRMGGRSSLPSSKLSGT